uniref:F-box protein Hrt3/FBXO9 C-terminal domain-containing protein n=1 Tax=Chromera velia CCMP2878 TaxID=1169474 RepID=A0A0G4G4H2_9ALVE|eukprot:Cvel_4171.t1-p1 / transcript=Cvel_4171.t1 / gene=Cvel_4171 / organism=Chromera_velia_CCMP2878 / gene_product=hypothetical protein / transcript_product=hypothetical protein / location=Cvel_scaffold179:105723-114789(-) / protein_length=505 / sequence_SO=supercontig / SO=protein_coding / is_pseudo=false
MTSRSPPRKIADPLPATSPAPSASTAASSSSSSSHDAAERKAVAIDLWKKGLAFESMGRIMEAVEHYRKAEKLYPDLDQRNIMPDNPEGFSLDPSEREAKAATALLSDEPPTGGSLSGWSLLLSLPEEIVQRFPPFMDAFSLDRAAMSCRPLFRTFRSQDVWRCLCALRFGKSCLSTGVVGGSSDSSAEGSGSAPAVSRGGQSEGEGRAEGTAVGGGGVGDILPSLPGLSNDVRIFGSDWRRMYLEKLRIRYDGVYISKNTYFRKVRDVGNIHMEEPKGHNKKPLVAVTFWRYIRFIPGTSKALVVRSEADPRLVVRALKAFDLRNPAHTGEREREQGSDVQGLRHQQRLSQHMQTGGRGEQPGGISSSSSGGGAPSSSQGGDGRAFLDKATKMPSATLLPNDETVLNREAAKLIQDILVADWRVDGDVVVLHYANSKDAPVFTIEAELQLSHLPRGRFNSRLKWMACKETHLRAANPESCPLTLSNEHFKPFALQRIKAYEVLF